MDNKTFDQLFAELKDQNAIDQDIVSFKDTYNRIKALNPKRILEVGSRRCGTIKMWQHMLPEDGLVVGVDLGLFSELWVDLAGSPPAKMIVGDSHSPNVIQRVQRFADDALFDAIFIDGDHSYEGVKADYENYAPMVRSGGLVVFHDHGHGPILKFWNELNVPGKTVIKGSLTIGLFQKV